MKRISGILAALLLVVITCFGGGASVEARSGFDIEKHIVEVNVTEEGVLQVTETMDVHFKDSTHHGIYVNIPSSYNMKWEMNGQTIYKNYKFPVRRIKVLSGHKNDISTYSSGVQIKIGDPDRYAKEYETYKFRYEIVTRDLDLDGLQMLFLNIISGNWEENILRVEFSITMPKPFDRNRLMFDSPAGLTKESTGPFTVVVTGNTINGSYADTLHPGEALTVQLMLGNDYFKFPDINQKAILGMIIAGITALISVICFYVFGKDDPVVETVEFHAPAGITSAEVGVIIDGVANDGDVISLILDWARRGLITITDDEKDLILTKKADLEENHRHFETIMFERLFKKGDTVVVSSLEGKFYNTIRKTEEALDRYFDKETRNIFTKQSLWAQFIGVVLSFLPITLMAAILVYQYEFDGGHVFLVGMFTVPTIIASTGILIYMETNKYSHKWYTKSLLILLSTVLFGIACFTLLVVTSLVDAAIGYSIGAILFNSLLIFCVLFMKKRTEYSNQLLGQILGLRNFILVAEKDRLQELVDENPYYFYDILPYAYALGLTNVWNEHFKDLTIEPCDWYISPRSRPPYYMTHSLESHMHTIEHSLTTVPATASGGSSFGGSSGGGGGGGGFSGGGFGGSGGGGW